MTNQNNKLKTYGFTALVCAGALAAAMAGMRFSQAAERRTEPPAAATESSAVSSETAEATTAAGNTETASSAEETGTTEEYEVPKIEIEKTVPEATVDPSSLKTDTTLDQNWLPDDVESTIYGEDAAMQIVVFGDSQFGNFKDNNGLAARLSRYCQANVYNLAIGGTTCALLEGERESLSEWTSTCGLGMVHAACKKLSPEFFKEKKYVYNVFNSCDFSKTDVFVIEYGVNDYLSKVPMTSSDGRNNLRTYAGALSLMIMELKSTYPKAQVFVCAPTYAQFFAGANGAYLGDGNILSNGDCCLVDIARTAEGIANAENATCMNAYFSLGFGSVNAKEYLEDGIHMNDAGRKKYAELLGRMIIRSQGYEIEEGADPSEVNWRK